MRWTARLALVDIFSISSDTMMESSGHVGILINWQQVESGANLGGHTIRITEALLKQIITIPPLKMSQISKLIFHGRSHVDERW